MGETFPEAWTDPHADTTRILGALRTVLMALPRRDFARVEAASVRIIYDPRAWGRLITCTLPPSRQQQHLRVIYIDPAAGSWSHRRLCGLLGHELAHLAMRLRTEHEPLARTMRRNPEADADALARAWGFPRPGPPRSGRSRAR